MKEQERMTLLHEHDKRAMCWILIVAMALLSLMSAYAFWAKINSAWPFVR